MDQPLSTADLRRMTPEELEQLGHDSLRDHLVAQAVVAHQKYAPLTFEKLDLLLKDLDSIRYPLRLVYEFGEMGMHQFAQPDIDWRNVESQGRVLYLRPSLQERPEGVVLAVAYMLPLVNYGEIISDEHCLIYGATLLGLTVDEFYQKICTMADGVWADVKFKDEVIGCGSSSCH